VTCDMTPLSRVAHYVIPIPLMFSRLIFRLSKRIAITDVLLDEIPLNARRAPARGDDRAPVEVSLADFAMNCMRSGLTAMSLKWTQGIRFALVDPLDRIAAACRDP